MADEKKKSKQTKAETKRKPKQTERSEAWEKIKSGETEFDIKAVPKYPHLAFADHFPITDDEPPTLEEQLGYVQEEMEAYNRLTEILKNEAASMTEQVNRLQQLDITPDNLTEWRETIRQITEAISATWQDYFTGIKEAISQHILVDPEVISSMQELSDALAHNDYIQEKLAEYRQLEPYIKAELKKRGKEELSELSKEEINEVEAAAREAMAAGGVSIVAKRPNALQFPLTKIQRDLFSKLAIETADKKVTPGQLAFSDISLAIESSKDKNERTILYSIQFSDIDTANISKALTQYDRRVYDAISSLFAAGNDVVTVSQVYSMMGNQGRPNARQVKKINDSLDKMASAWITLDQSQDYSKYTDEAKGKIGATYKGQLIYLESMEATINGKYVEKAIHIIKEPVLYTLAKDRGQISAIPRAALETGKSQTEDYINLENYLFDRISQIKNEKRKSSNKIKYSSLYDALGITGNSNALKVKRSRTLATMMELLEHYKAIKWITGYKETKNAKGEPGVEIFY